MVEQVYQFETKSKPIFCERYGNGHINTTYRIIDALSEEYILQKINKHVFKNPIGLMNNIILVTDYLKHKVNEPREVLTIVPTKSGEKWLFDSEGEYWRMYEFVRESISFQQATTELFKESAIAFGLFQKRLEHFPAENLFQTIPHFHDTPYRYKTFHKILKDDTYNLAKNVQREIDFYLERENYSHTLVDREKSGALPLRVTHNDTKLNNVLFDIKTRKNLCVIDLDTVMPGLSVNDYGDSIRFGATTGAEDEIDISKVKLSIPLFTAYTSGYLSACGKSLCDEELESLRDGAKMMTLECGLRFLTDYLSGDTYFHIERKGHNLDRTRTQMKLVQSMEEKWDLMQDIIMKEILK